MRIEKSSYGAGGNGTVAFGGGITIEEGGKVSGSSWGGITWGGGAYGGIIVMGKGWKSISGTVRIKRIQSENISGHVWIEKEVSKNR